MKTMAPTVWRQAARRITLRRWLRAAGVVFALASGLGAADAQPSQSPPTSVLKLVVPYPPGGITDVAARAIAERLGLALGQTVIVENRSGAGSRLGTQAVAQAAADGQTLLFTNLSLSTLPLVDRTVRFDPITGFAPVGLAAVYGAALVVNTSVPANSLSELVVQLKRHPGQFSYGSAGIGSGSHFVGEAFKTLTGSFVVHIPYRSTGAALNDVAGGQIQIAFDANAKPLVDAGKVKALAIVGAQRDPRFPLVPTAAEAGVKGLDFNAWLGLLAPAGTPLATVARLNQALNTVLQDPALRRQFETLGLIPRGGPPDRLTQQLRDDAVRYRRLIQDAKLSFDPG
jgi:tripartite-type tricarboxylate transporter receptor subunit TctC